jgi:hypothetical protein
MFQYNLLKEPENTGNILYCQKEMTIELLWAAARLIEDVWLTFRSLATRNK